MKPLILIGGGDHCKSVIDVVEQENKFRIKGIIDIAEKVGQKVLGYQIIATDNDLDRLIREYGYFFITIGHVKSADKRKAAFSYLKRHNILMPNIISPLAYVSKHAKLGEGTIVFPFSIIDVDAQIGDNCIINHSTTIGHGAVIENHCHISANCVLGKCIVGTGTFIGGNSWINNLVEIKQNSIIGSGTNVIKTLNESGTYIGNPARKIV